MKRILSIIFILALTFTFSSCSSKDESAISKDNSSSSNQNQVEEAKEIRPSLSEENPIDKIATAIGIHFDPYDGNYTNYKVVGAIDGKFYNLDVDKETNIQRNVTIYQYDINSTEWQNVLMTGNMHFFDDERLIYEYPEGYPYHAFKDGFAIIFGEQVHDEILNKFLELDIKSIT